MANRPSILDNENAKNYYKGRMDPVYPCVEMDTRACVDGVKDEEGEYVECWYRDEVCPDICGRFGVRVDGD